MNKIVNIFKNKKWKKYHDSALSCFMKTSNFLVAPKSNDESVRRREYILNVLLIGLIIFLCVLTAYVYYRSSGAASGINPLTFTCIPFIFCLYHLMSRKGYVFTAGLLFIGTLYVGATYGIIMWGFGLHMSLLTYVLIINMSSILFGTTAGFISTTTIGTTLIIVSWLQTSGILNPNWYWLHEPDKFKAGQFFFGLLLITIVSWLANREIKRSLNRANESEKALRNERDQLEIKVVERTAELKRSQLDQIAEMYKLVEFGRLSSGIFHDLMSPLNAVAICVEQLSKGDVAKGDIQKYVALAVSASRRMHEFLNKAGKQLKNHEVHELFDVRTTFKEASELLNYKARLQGVRISIDSSEIHIVGNPLRFHQIANNLLSNAIDSFDTLETSRGVQKNIQVTFKSAPLEVEISVTDNGSGIPAGNIGRIFDPFFTTKSIHKGTGIGLSITKSIIENEFGGRITVNSNIGTGTTFMIFIPIKTTEPKLNPYSKLPTSSSTPTK